MKKIFSLFLAMGLMLSLCTPSFATDQNNQGEPIPNEDNSFFENADSSIPEEEVLFLEEDESLELVEEISLEETDNPDLTEGDWPFDETDEPMLNDPEPIEEESDEFGAILRNVPEETKTLYLDDDWDELVESSDRKSRRFYLENLKSNIGPIKVRIRAYNDDGTYEWITPAAGNKVNVGDLFESPRIDPAYEGYLVEIKASGTNHYYTITYYDA